MKFEELRELTVDVFHDHLQRGELTIEAVTSAYLDRIERYDKAGPELNAILTVNDTAIDRAQELDSQLEGGTEIEKSLYGVPVVIKDQATTAGLRTTFGSVAFADYVPAESATVVDRLEAAGAIILAKTNLPDFAAGFVGYSSAGGQTRNPYDRTRDSGGSSAGTAAAVAADFALVGVGEDTGGSIRVPASFCNLFGLRVTTGLISRAGMSPLVAEQDTPGPMCRTVDDLARLLDVIVGFDPADEATAIHAEWSGESFVEALDETTLEDARIGVLRTAFGERDEPRVTAVNSVVEEALDTLEAAGATLVGPVEIPELETFLDDTSLYGLVAKRDLNQFFDGLDESPVDSFEEIYEQGAYHEALEHIETIAAAPADPTTDREYWWRLARQAAFRQAIEYTLAEQDLDALAFPDVQVLPPEYEGYHTGELTRADVPTNTFIASQSGCPAISMPAGFTEDGLPVGLELLGAPLSDRRLVGFATAYEAVADPRESPKL